jgi:hypothetical protein
VSCTQALRIKIISKQKFLKHYVAPCRSTCNILTNLRQTDKQLLFLAMQHMLIGSGNDMIYLEYFTRQLVEWLVKCSLGDGIVSWHESRSAIFM